MGMGPGPISWLTIEQYSRLMGLDEEQTAAMHYHIVQMDTAFLKHINKKNK